MKSMVIKEFGGINVFQEMELPKPTIKAKHLLIKVMATSVNPLDYKIRAGFLPRLVTGFPAVLHGDVAGVVEQVGEGVENFSVGDEVYGCAGGLLDMGGALSEYLLADADLIAKKPKNLSFSEAAALPLVALTAWEGLVTSAKVKSGQTLLVHGGTGGVGHIAIQLAHWLGAEVFSTSSSDFKMNICKKLGAKVAINYKEASLENYVQEYTKGAGFDVVFDTVGGENLSNSFVSAAHFGQVISVLAAGSYDLSPAFLKGLTLHLLMQPLPLITGLNRDRYGIILSKIAELVEAGLIVPLIDQKKFRIREVGAAHAHLEQGEVIGKVIISSDFFKLSDTYNPL